MRERLFSPFFTVLFVVLVLLPLLGHELFRPRATVAQTPPATAPTPAPQTLSEGELHRPLPVPDRVILTWKGDPARSQAVTWRTDTSVTAAVAQIAPADPGPHLVRKSRTVRGTTTALRSDLGAAHYHSVAFSGLDPATRYAYRVGDGTHWSEWFQFRTAAVQPEPFSFIYFGDAQNDLKSLWSRVIREAYSDVPKARFIIHAGDLVNRANRDAEWGEWFGAGGWVNGMVPSVPSPGNHEYDRVGQPGSPRELSHHWRPQFTLPEDGPPGLSETVYSIDYQGLRIISLNSNERQADQVSWLEARLQNNPNPWTVVTFHHPIYSAAQNRDNKPLRELWEPVFRRYRVDLVLQGHDHTYARSGLRNLPSGMSTQDPRNGTVYVVSVSGPKMYNLEREPWMRRAAADTQLYQVITVDGDRLRYQARAANGELYDAFELQKRGGRVNRLIDRIPDSPERLELLTAPPAVSPPAPAPPSAPPSARPN